MFYTINSSPMLVTKSVFKLIFILSNYQTCTFPLKSKSEQTLNNSSPITMFFFCYDKYDRSFYSIMIFFFTVHLGQLQMFYKSFLTDIKVVQMCQDGNQQRAPFELMRTCERHYKSTGPVNMVRPCPKRRLRLQLRLDQRVYQC